MEERTLHGLVDRFVTTENFEVVSEEKIRIKRKERGALQKARVIADRICERGENAFINPEDNHYDVVIRDVQ